MLHCTDVFKMVHGHVLFIIANQNILHAVVYILFLLVFSVERLSELGDENSKNILISALTNLC